jgi:hypothetical protein
VRATAGYCFSPLFGLRRASWDFVALYADKLKARDTKGDRGNFPCKTRFRQSLGFKSPLSAMILRPYKAVTFEVMSVACPDCSGCVVRTGELHTAGYPKEENLLRVLHQPPRLGLLNPLSNTVDFANRIDLLETLEIESGSRTSVTPHRSWPTDKIIPPSPPVLCFQWVGFLPKAFPKKSRKFKQVHRAAVLNCERFLWLPDFRFTNT